MDLHLDGKRALVLASSKGIGRASAMELAREGASVAISSRSESNLKEAKEFIVDETDVPSERILTVTCDLSDTVSIADQVMAAINRLGGLDVLVTNSGGPDKIDFEKATLEQFDQTYELVVKSVIAAIDAALPALKDGGGVITNIIAASVQQPDANHVLANTVRPSIYGLAKSLSHEYADDGIRVNNVCPKKVGPATPQEKDRTTHISRYADEQDLSYEKAREEYIAQIIPRGTYGDLDEFGKAVAYVSSDVAKHITGHSLNVDGGWVRSTF